MSETVPDTADKGVREFLGAVGFTLVLTGGEMMADKEGLRFWIGVALVLAALPVYLSGALWKALKPHINQRALVALDAFVDRLPWWIRGALIVILAIFLSQIIGLRISLFTESVKFPDWLLLTAIGIGLIFFGILVGIQICHRQKASDAVPPNAANQISTRRMTVYELEQRQRDLDKIDTFIDEQRIGTYADQFNWERSFQNGGTEKIIQDLNAFSERLRRVNDSILDLKNHQRYSDIADLIAPLDLGAPGRPMPGMANDLSNVLNILRDIARKHRDAQPDLLRARNYFDSWKKYSSMFSNWSPTTRRTVAAKRLEYSNVQILRDE